jgi:hypothetical protein
MLYGRLVLKLKIVILERTVNACLIVACLMVSR